MIIEDGRGSGRKAEVDSHNHLKTHSVSELAIAEASEQDGDAYAWTASADIDATDSILWLRNDSTTQNLIIDTISISSDAAGSWFIYCPENVTPDGTTVTGVNLNRASSKVALATCKRDNTTAVLANYIFYGHNQAAETVVMQLRGALVLGYLDCVAIDITTEPVLAQATILGYFHPAE
jgi:hypothetical protein